jgi:release factor glutamine methyltransferase
MKRSDWPNPNKVSAPLSLGDWLTQARSAIKALPDEPTSSLYAIIAFALDKPAYWAQAHPEFSLDTKQITHLNHHLQRLLAGEPLPYIIGKQAFYGLDFIVSPHVLIPRPETELLIETALAWLSEHPAARQCADVGTGSGCIAVAIADHNPHVRFTASDLSYPSLLIARQNIHQLQLSQRIDLLQTDLLLGLQVKFDLICANMPYIPTHKLKNLRVSQYEPISALDGGRDGLTLIDQLLEQAHTRTKASGMILLEIEFSQSDAIATLIHSHFPNAGITITNDLNNQPRLVKITL